MRIPMFLSKYDASKRFNMEKDIVKGIDPGVRDPSIYIATQVFDTGLMFFCAEILHNNHEYFKNNSYPLYFPVIYAIIHIAFGIIPLAALNLKQDQKVSSIGRIGMGIVLFAYAFYSRTASDCPNLFYVYLITVYVKVFLSLFIQIIMLRLRCSLHINAVCIGLYDAISAQWSFSSKACYVPVLEYKAPVVTKKWNDTDIVPSMETVTVEKTYYTYADSNTDYSIRYGATVDLLINPKDPEDICYLTFGPCCSAIAACLALLCFIAQYFAELSG